MGRPPRTLLEVCAVRAGGFRGLLKAGRVCEFIVEWAIAMDDQGSAPTGTAEFARWWRRPERSTQRAAAEFRELFPEYSDPTPIAALLVEQMGDRFSSMDDFGRMTVPYPMAAAA